MAANVLFIMTDQQRFDTIQTLGADGLYTPNLDRLVERGISFLNAYSTCPVCVPARCMIRTGCEPPTTRIFTNVPSAAVRGQAPTVTGRCGNYLARSMGDLGYRTFGIGKFHTHPWDEDLGYDVHVHTEELFGDVDQRMRDAYARHIRENLPAYGHVEQLHGEHTVESFVADRAVEQIARDDGRPFFGFVSFIGPHPPFAPPVPYNRMYNPDRMPTPVRGDRTTDHMDEHLPWMNHLIWAEDVGDSLARVLWARYYGEITYIDACIGRVLDGVEARADADDTTICFFSDHGDHMGDQHSWQKESFFEQSCHIPFLVSRPSRLPTGVTDTSLVALTDLFGIATRAIGTPALREGIDVIGCLSGESAGRSALTGYYGEPGTPLFKIMVRSGTWKYIFFANGGGEQLFDLSGDPNELMNRIGDAEAAVVAADLRQRAVEACRRPGLRLPNREAGGVAAEAGVVLVGKEGEEGLVVGGEEVDEAVAAVEAEDEAVAVGAEGRGALVDVAVAPAVEVVEEGIEEEARLRGFGVRFGVGPAWFITESKFAVRFTSTASAARWVWMGMPASASWRSSASRRSVRRSRSAANDRRSYRRV